LTASARAGNDSAIMKPAAIVGILLIVIGVVALAYQGVSYTTHEKKNVVDLGPLQVNATVEREKRIPLPPIVGIAALAGGVVLVIVGQRR
jgi:hypothetical protein